MPFNGPVLPCGHSGILQLLMLCSISPEHSPTRPDTPSSILRRRVRDDREPHVAEHDDHEPHVDHAQPPKEKGLEGEGNRVQLISDNMRAFGCQKLSFYIGMTFD